MDSEPKQRFNNQLIQESYEQTNSYKSTLNITPYKRILSLIKAEDVNGLKNFLESIENSSHYINQFDKDLHQTVLYQAVQCKNKSISYSLTNTLIQYGVKS